jgi:hypothetical protein
MEASKGLSVRPFTPAAAAMPVAGAAAPLPAAVVQQMTSSTPATGRAASAPSATIGPWADESARTMAAGLKAAVDLLASIIASPLHDGSEAQKAQVAAEVFGSCFAELERLLPAVTDPVLANGYLRSLLMQPLVRLACDQWRRSGRCDIGPAVQTLLDLSRTAEFHRFADLARHIDWNRAPRDVLECSTLLRMTALQASEKLHAEVQRFSFYQTDHEPLMRALLEATHRVASSAPRASDDDAPGRQALWARAVLNRAASLVCAEYRRVADETRDKLAGRDDAARTRLRDQVRAALSETTPSRNFVMQIELRARQDLALALAGAEQYVREMQAAGQVAAQDRTVN